MTIRERYDVIFRNSLMLPPEEPLRNLDMMSVPSWNSVEHFSMICALEEEFGITLHESEIMAFTSYEKGIEILKNHGVQVI